MLHLRTRSRTTNSICVAQVILILRCLATASCYAEVDYRKVSPPNNMPASASTRSQDEDSVRGWGFHHVFTWTDPPRAHYPPHSHSGLTTHLIRRGSMIITYPNDTNPAKEVFGVGARIDVAAGKIHEVWIGDQGAVQLSPSKSLSI